jgi:hypothetical protein
VSIEIAESTLKAFEGKKMEALEKLREASEKLEEICKKEADSKEKFLKIENATSKVKRFLNCFTRR